MKTMKNGSPVTASAPAPNARYAAAMIAGGTSGAARSRRRRTNVHSTMQAKVTIAAAPKCQPIASPCTRSSGADACARLARSCGQPSRECAAALAIINTPARMPRMLRVRFTGSAFGERFGDGVQQVEQPGGLEGEGTAPQLVERHPDGFVARAVRLG